MVHVKSTSVEGLWDPISDNACKGLGIHLGAKPTMYYTTVKFEWSPELVFEKNKKSMTAAEGEEKMPSANWPI